MASHAAPAGNSTTGSSSPYQNAATQAYLDGLNKSLGQNYLWALLGVVGALLAHSAINKAISHLRHLTSLDSAGALRYFSSTSNVVSWIKRNIVYAPILYSWRAREIKLSQHVNLGTLPTRFQASFITLLVATNLFASLWNIPWNDPELEFLPILRNRTGTLSVVNLLPIMVLASIKNPLIALLDISYDTFNLNHRWFGRLSAAQAIVHTLCWLVAKVKSKGWSAVKASIPAPFIYSGLIGTICMLVIMLHSPKVFRYLAYEFFLHTHIALVVVLLVFLWRHLEDLPQQKYLLGAIILWAAFRCWRMSTLLYRSLGRGGTKARIDPLNGGAVKITLKVSRPWKYRPGQSLYLTVPSIGLWTAHPFSVAWSGAEDALGQSVSRQSSFNEKNFTYRKRSGEVEKAQGEETISLIVKKHTGVTHKLWHHGMVGEAGVDLTALVEGPYGNERSLSSYGTVILFASGVGITHQLGYVKQLVQGFAEGTVATKRITLVWVMPSTECLDWIREWMHEILGMERRRDCLKVLLYITRAGLSQAIQSPSEQVRMMRGRPDVMSIVAREATYKCGCMGLSVCSSGGLADEVRSVSRLLLKQGVNLDLMEEGFGW